MTSACSDRYFKFSQGAVSCKFTFHHIDEFKCYTHSSYQSTPGCAGSRNVGRLPARWTTTWLRSQERYQYTINQFGI